MTGNDRQQTEYEESIDTTASNIERMLEKLMGQASTSTLFSEPHVVGDDLVFTAAAWERGGGFGFGAGAGADPEGGSGTGGGGGGGGGSQGRPVAVIRIGPGGIEVRPVIDFTRIGVTALIATIGVWRALRRGR